MSVSVIMLSTEMRCFSPRSTLYAIIGLPFVAGSFQLRCILEADADARTASTGAGLLAGVWPATTELYGPAPALFTAYKSRYISWVWVLCCLMTPGLSRDIWWHVRPHSFCLQITTPDIRPHAKWAVSLVVADGHLNLLHTVALYKDRRLLDSGSIHKDYRANLIHYQKIYLWSWTS